MFDKPIRLKCRRCGHEMDYARDIDQSLPPNVASIEANICPECDDGDFGTEYWLDADGNEISQAKH